MDREMCINLFAEVVFLHAQRAAHQGADSVQPGSLLSRFLEERFPDYEMHPDDFATIVRRSIELIQNG